MHEIQEPEARIETLVAAVIYLMTQYAKTGCPRVAVCISRHLQCLAAHGDAPRVVRDVCASLHGAWSREGAAPPSDVRH